MSKLVSYAWREDIMALDIRFADGSERRINLHELSQGIKNRLMLHGAQQKLADSYSGFGKRYGEDAAAEAKKAVERLIDEAWMQGDWALKREGAGGQSSLWEAAFAKAGVKAKRFASEEDGRQYYRHLDQAKKAKARQIAEVVKMKQELEAQRADDSASFDDI